MTWQVKVSDLPSRLSHLDTGEDMRGEEMRREDIFSGVRAGTMPTR